MSNFSDISADPLYLQALANLGASVPEKLKPAPTKGSVAVLPFANLGGDPEQDYFAEGIAEDILTELSRFRGLFVFARNSSFFFKGKGLGIQEIAKALNVEYVVSGSVRRNDTRVRVAAQLAHAATGQEIWAERYDRELADVFKVQDEVVRTIVITLESRLGLAMANEAANREPPSLAVYECVQLAKKFINVHNFAGAKPYLDRALLLDANFALVHVKLSGAYYVNYMESSESIALDQCVAAASRSVELDPSDSRCHAALGIALTIKRQFELAGAHLLRAIELNPADTTATAYYAEWLIRNGDAAAGLALMDQLLLRDPIPPQWHWEIRAMALMLLERYQDALVALSLQSNKLWYVYGCHAICHARLGQTQSASVEIEKLLQLRPDMTVHRFAEQEVFKNVEDVNFFASGLRLAGLPE